MTKARIDARINARTIATPSEPPATSHWQSLQQRFDTLALRPPAVSADDAALARYGLATRAALLAWCVLDAGPGGTSFWRPDALPRVNQRLVIGTLRIPGSADKLPVASTDTRSGPGPEPGPEPEKAGAPHEQQSTGTALCLPAIAPTAWIDHVARQLDGSLRLAARPGRVAGLASRLGVKLDDAMWWRQRQIGDPWDAGWALTTPAALHQLQTAFWPRRATLVLADAASRAPLQTGLAALCQRQAGLRHPVRWLWVGDDDDLRALPAWPGLPITHFAAA